MKLHKLVIAQLLILIIFVHALQTHASNTKSEEKIQIRWYTQLSDHKDDYIRIAKERFVEKFNEKVYSYLFDKIGKVKERFFFLLNGKIVTLETKVNDGDVLAILPPIIGG